MQIVIDIDEDTYNQVSNNDAYVLSEVDYILIENAIANGTPLPKGHGRLIDENDLWPHCIDFCVAYDDILSAPTIIEADKGEE